MAKPGQSPALAVALAQGAVLRGDFLGSTLRQDRNSFVEEKLRNLQDANNARTFPALAQHSCGSEPLAQPRMQMCRRDAGD